jgi:hypothetical protein
MTAMLIAKDEVHATALIAEMVEECRLGKSDRELEAIGIATLWGLDVDEVRARFVVARDARREAELKAAEVSAPLPVAKPAWRRIGGEYSGPKKISPTAQPKAPPEDNAIALDTAILAQNAPKPKPAFTFHPSDFAASKAAPPTIEEKNQALEKLAVLWKSDPLAYTEQKRELADRLCTTIEAVEKAVKIVRNQQPENGGEQSQTTKIVAIGVGEDVRLWHSPMGANYATVRVGDHWENYRLDSTAFERWLQNEYGRRNQFKIGDEWIRQAPGSGALRDAVKNLEGVAAYNADERKPAMRVGGGREVIWIDLGGANWKAARVTAEGWDIVSDPDVAFIRSGPMLALPEPTRGGSVEPLRRVINLQSSDFVLGVGWLLQVLNPMGPYPLINVFGDSEAGKSFTSKTLLRAVDPNLVPLRKAKKPDDLLIACNNSWTVGLDNLSWMSADFSDTLCMVATGIATGARAHYTNDEEHVFTVQRPLLFNGIAEHLTERSDLASRTIKLHILPLTVRRTEADLDEEFERIWPSVFGALLDGLVGALRNARSIAVPNPARLMDFERFAEAGCRAMGFGEWEFVEAYAANREGSMVASAEASAVGRAVVALMKRKPDGFAGPMTALHGKLGAFKGNANWRDWPKDATRLSGELSRIVKPLAAMGIDCERNVDRRGEEGGTQRDVVLKWRD